MRFNSIIKSAIALFSVGFFISCDNDVSELGSNIVGGENTNLHSYVTENLVAYNKATGPVQANGYSLNGLGIINDPVFGKTTANYVTQLKFPAGTNPVADIVNPTVLRVELTVPYFSKRISVDADGANIYTLDSLYSSQNSKIKLSVYESGYYLNDFDASSNFEQAQRYYSDMNNVIDNAKIGNRLNDDISAAENDAFYFSPAEQLEFEIVDGEHTIKERLSPRMRLKLNKEFFINKIFNAPAGVMNNDNSFKNYFKGLYFKVEDLGLGDHYSQLDFSQGKITIYYTDLNSNNEVSDEKTVVLNFGGNSVSLLQNDFNPAYQNAVSSGDDVQGDEKLYLKGGNGSVAFLDLFTGQDSDQDGISDELEDLQVLAKQEKWLINDANLVFYVDRNLMNSAPYFARRIYMYDAENKIPLLDYYSDITTFPSFPKYNKYVHGGIVDLEDGKPLKVKVRITKLIQNLLKVENATNKKIGISVTESINDIAMAMLKDQVGLPSNSPYKYIPAASVMSPLGIVLYGNNTSELDKKLKLEILYTKP